MSLDIKRIQKLKNEYERSSCMYRKVECIELHLEGMSNKEIAKIIDINVRSVQRYIKDYYVSGAENLKYINNRGRKRIENDDEYLKMLLKCLEDSPRKNNYLVTEWSPYSLAHYCTRYSRKMNYHQASKLIEKYNYKPQSNVLSNDSSVWLLGFYEKHYKFRPLEKFKMKTDMINGSYCIIVAINVDIQSSFDNGNNIHIGCIGSFNKKTDQKKVYEELSKIIKIIVKQELPRKSKFITLKNKGFYRILSEMILERYKNDSMLVGIEFIERTPRYDYMLCQVRTEINRLCKEKDYRCLSS